MSEGLGWNAGMLLGTACWKSLRITAVTVTTSATALPTTPLSDRKGVWIWNPSANGATLYVGGSGITGTTNPEVFAGASLPLPLSDQMTLYGRAASSITVIVWEYGI